MVETET